MIMKAFYDEEDYMVVKKLLSGRVKVTDEERERVFTRQMFMESIQK